METVSMRKELTYTDTASHPEETRLTLSPKLLP